MVNSVGDAVGDARAERPALLRPGEMFEGFRIVRFLGRGGVGEVFEIAFQGTRMALKVVRLPQGCNERQLQKLLREGRIQGWIKHPNVVEVHETGVTRTGLAWIRMELLRGLSMRDVLHAQGTLSIALTVHYLRQVGIALQQCHRLGAVHRDTKPENLFVLTDHRIKLLDFGIAKLYGTGETHEGGCQGTPPYMAPEQLRGRPVTPATDVYAVGLIAHEMLWGAHPFVEDLSSYDPHALISRQFFERPPLLTEVGVPEPLARVVERALSKNPEARQQDGLLFAEDVWAAWERMRDSAPELDTLADDIAVGPGAGSSRSARRAASMGAVSNAVTRRLPLRGTAGRARTVRLPDADRDPSCVEALSARQEVNRAVAGPDTETGPSSRPEWSEIRARGPGGGTRFDTVTLPAAKPFGSDSGRGGAEGAQPTLVTPIVIAGRRPAAAEGRKADAQTTAGVQAAMDSPPRREGRFSRGRGFRVAERVGILLLGLMAGMALQSMVMVPGEEARGRPAPSGPQPSPERSVPEPPAEASLQDAPQLEASVGPVALEPERAAVADGRPSMDQTDKAKSAAPALPSKARSSARPSAPAPSRVAPAPPKRKRLIEIIE